MYHEENMLKGHGNQPERNPEAQNWDTMSTNTK